MPRTPMVTDVFVIGMMVPYDGREIDVPTGWLLCIGDTIGDATSGGTARANADTQGLFVKRWNATNNTDVPIQDSTGTPTTRGADALSDFNAHKRLPLPNMKKKMPVGYDSGDADFASIGKIGGNKTITLDVTKIPSHGHSASSGWNDRSHGHSSTQAILGINGSNQFYGGMTGGGLWSPQYWALEGRAMGGADSGHLHGITVNAEGGSGAHDNMSPFEVKTYIIKY